MRALRLWSVSGGRYPISSSSPATMRRSAFESLRMNDGLASTKCGSWYPRASANVSTWSPPIVCASDAKSSRVETTWSFAAASPCASAAAVPRRTKRNMRASFMLASEGMGAVGADGELHLEQDLVGGLGVEVPPPAQLRSDLLELARPEREEERRA